MHKATHQKLSSFITTSTITTTTTINRIILSNLLRHCKKKTKKTTEISPHFFYKQTSKAQAKQLIKTNKKAENLQAYIKHKDPEKR